MFQNKMAEKLFINKQKNFRKNLIEKHVKIFNEHFEAFNFIIFPQSYNIMKSTAEKSSIISGRANVKNFQPINEKNYYEEFEYKKDIVKIVAGFLEKISNQSLYLKFSNFHSPIFDISAIWFKNFFYPHILEREMDDLFEFDLFSKDYSIGISIRSYGGYLNELSREEIVYEVEVWGIENFKN